MRYKVKFLLHFFILAGISFAIHAALYRFTSLGQTAAEFQFSLTTLYLFFGISAIVVLGILAFLPTRFTDNFGFVFIGLTLLKIGITFWFFHSIIGNPTGFNPSEKRQVFLVFAWFLALETYLSARILNTAQQTLDFSANPPKK